MNEEIKSILRRHIEGIVDDIMQFPLLSDECKTYHAIALMEWGITRAMIASNLEDEEKTRTAMKLYNNRIKYIEEGKC